MSLHDFLWSDVHKFLKTFTASGAPFDGEDFEGDADAELAPSEYDDEGMGAVVAGLHVVCESSDEGEDESLAHLAALIRVLYSAGQVPTWNTLEWCFISTRWVLYTKEYLVKNGKQHRRRPYMAGAVRSLHTPPHVAGGACT